MRTIQKPPAGEHPAYAPKYFALVPDDGQVMQHLEQNLNVLRNYVLSLSESKLSTPFAAGEWTVKEILMHLIDAERIFVYRAMRFARNDKTELPGFEPDDYTPETGANELTLAAILDEYEAVRKATLLFFQNLPEAALTRIGSARGNPMSPRAALYQIAGHELHHLASIRENYS